MVQFGCQHIHHAEELHHPGDGQGESLEGQGLFDAFHQIKVGQVLPKYPMTGNYRYTCAKLHLHVYETSVTW